MKLEGRVALVTGASQGIGHACALALAREGASVAVAARNRQKLDELVAEITAAGGNAAAFVTLRMWTKTSWTKRSCPLAPSGRMKP